MSSSSGQWSRVPSLQEEASKPAKQMFSYEAQKVLDNAKIIVNERFYVRLHARCSCALSAKERSSERGMCIER